MLLKTLFGYCQRQNTVYGSCSTVVRVVSSQTVQTHLVIRHIAPTT